MRVPQLWSNTKLDALLVNIIQHVVQKATFEFCQSFSVKLNHQRRLVIFYGSPNTKLTGNRRLFFISLLDCFLNCHITLKSICYLHVCVFLIHSTVNYSNFTQCFCYLTSKKPPFSNFLKIQNFISLLTFKLLLSLEY